MHKALIACRAGVGSSLMLKIKVNEVIRENDFQSRWNMRL